MSAATVRSLQARIVAAVQVPSRKPRRTADGKVSGRAKILDARQLDHLLHHIQATSQDPLRDYAIMLLSFRGGLRACEIAGLSWRDVTDARGKVGQSVTNPVTGETEIFFTVPNGIAKNGHGRSIPMHPALKATLEALYHAHGTIGPLSHDPVIRGKKSPRMTANALVQYIVCINERAGLQGTSHSGRRTLLTHLAQTANSHHCSLFDVQQIAGHADIETTEAYVEASPHVGKMMRAVR